MRSTRIAAAALALAFFVHPLPTLAQDTSDTGSVAREALSSVVTIRAYNAAGEEMRLGSGFFLADGRVVTNSHVVAGAEWVEVMDQDEDLLGSAPYAEVLSTRSDLAILPALSAERSGLAVSQQTPQAGDPVWAIGSPEGLHGSVSSGVVSARRSLDGQRYLQISAPVSSGSSGGPILNQRGEVIGVVVSYVTDGQNLNFGVPADQLDALRDSPAGEYSFQSVKSAGESRSSRADDDSELEDKLGTPLENAPVLEVPDYMAGEITRSDLEREGKRFDLYRLQGEAGQTLTVVMVSDEFDTRVGIVEMAEPRGKERWMREDDDGGEGTNSKLTVTLPGSGEYVVLATTYGESLGEYAVAVYDESSSSEAGSSKEGAKDDRWYYVGESSSSIRWYIDRRSVTDLSLGRIRIWAKLEYGRPSAEYDEAQYRVVVDCDDRRYRVGSSLYYVDDELVDEGIGSEWSDIPPESMGEAVLESVCEDR